MTTQLDRPVSDKSPNCSSATPAKKPRMIILFGELAGLSLFFATALFGFAWWQTGSVEWAWPWLQGRGLVFEPAQIVLGEVPKNEIFLREIRVANLSSRPLALLGCQKSCGCITLDEFPIAIPPGEEHRLQLKIGVSDQAGPFEQSIKLFTDDHGYSSVHVAVTASVQ